MVRYMLESRSVKLDGSLTEYGYIGSASAPYVWDTWAELQEWIQRSRSRPTYWENGTTRIITIDA